MVRTVIKDKDFDFRTKFIYKMSEVASGLSDGSLLISDDIQEKMLKRVFDLSLTSNLLENIQSDDDHNVDLGRVLQILSKEYTYKSFIVWDICNKRIDSLSSDEYQENKYNLVILDVFDIKELLKVKSWSKNIFFDAKSKKFDFFNSQSKDSSMKYLHKRLGRKLQNNIKKLLIGNVTDQISYTMCGYTVYIFPPYLYEFKEVDNGGGINLFSLSKSFYDGLYRSYNDRRTRIPNVILNNNEYIFSAQKYIETNFTTKFCAKIDSTEKCTPTSTPQMNNVNICTRISVMMSAVRNLSLYINPEIDVTIKVLSTIMENIPKDTINYLRCDLGVETYLRGLVKDSRKLLIDNINKNFFSILYRQGELKDFDSDTVETYKSDFKKGFNFLLKNSEWFGTFDTVDIRKVINISNSSKICEKGLFPNKEEFYHSTCDELLSEVVRVSEHQIPVFVPGFDFSAVYNTTNLKLYSELESDCEFVLNLIRESGNVVFDTSKLRGDAEDVGRVPHLYLNILFQKLNTPRFKDLSVNFFDTDFNKNLLSDYLDDNKDKLKFLYDKYL